MHFHVKYGCYSQYDLKRFISCDRCECLVIVDTVDLLETLDDKSRFILLNAAIIVVLYVEDLFTR